MSRLREWLGPQHRGGVRSPGSFGAPRWDGEDDVESGDAGKAKALVKGNGTNLPDTLVPALALPVKAQLVNDTNSTCFEATYSTAIKNDAKQFEAKTP